MTALAEALGASRRFGRMLAVDHVDLRVEAGEVVGLLGANGAGKTTLIRLLLGLAPVTHGRVLLFGSAPSRRSRQQLGYVPQGLGLYDDLTPAENLAFERAAFGLGRRGPPSRSTPDANEIPGVPVRQLPLGLQRRAAFAQALDHRPSLLVLDEPTSGVDPLGRARLWEQIRDATDAGAGALVTTHHMEEAEECDRLVVMADGTVVARGTASEIVGAAHVVVVEGADWPSAFTALQDAGLRAALVGRSLRVPGTTPERVGAVLSGQAVRIAEQPATLEERFLELSAAGRPATDAP